MSSSAGPQRLGKYELRERLGHGAVAEVWKAFDPELQRYVAIKLLHTNLRTDPEFMTRFSREARVIAALHHPNIVQIHDFQTTYLPEMNAPVAYMVMDYIEGETLAHYIYATSRVGKFPSSTEIVHLFASISKAIDYAHQEGMLHRDIKPANILLDKRHAADDSMGEPILTDFGIAKIVGASSDTMTGMWLGTPLYVSPEQAQGYPGTERSDIYSLGVILYEICTGICPFGGDNITAIIMQQISSMPRPPVLFNPTIPPMLTAAILRAIAKHPADRFSSASALTVAIAEAFNLSHPAGLSMPANPSNANIGQTHPHPDWSRMSPHTPPPGAQRPQSFPVMDSLLPTLPSAQTNPPITSPPISGIGFPPIPPAHSTPVHSSFLPPPTLQREPAAASSSGSGVIFSPTPIVRRWGAWKRPLIIWLVVLFVLASSILFSLRVLYSGHASPVSTTVGDVIFLNSGQLDAQNSQGVDDEVQINLYNIPAPDTGKSYYAWLKNAPLADEGTWVLLGSLDVSHGNAQLPSPYQDPQHANLLIDASSFLVTEENRAIPPTQASTDRSTWHFFSEPPLVPLTHLRHLLGASPELQIRQLYGGLGIWFWRNTGKLVEWASSARDDAQISPADTGQIHRQLVRVLDYIDGTGSVSMDVPPSTPVIADPHEGQIALVGPPVALGPPGSLYNAQGEIPPGYVYLLRVHLDAAVESPQATPQQRQLAKQIDNALDQVRLDLEKVRRDASQLVGLSDTQLVTPQSQSLLNDLVAGVQSAYTGPMNPQEAQGGTFGIYENIQHMAVFEVQPYTK
jgi:serine/threonine protein kinase